MTFTVALVGRPNVGKSTLFNRLVGRRLALVDDQPGVTRDLREGDAKMGPIKFTVIDTAGLEEATDESLQGRMRMLTERAVDMADVCIFMMDARAGVLPADRVFAEILRKKSAQVVLVANKAEGNSGEVGFFDAFSLGLGEPVRLSGEHGEGMVDLQHVLMPISKEFEDKEDVVEPEIDVEIEELDDDESGLEITYSAERPLQISIIGRPNSGKSTLINQILGHERMLTGPEAGITRDSISINHEWDNVPMRLWDTAGIRKKAKVQEKLEKLSVSDGLRAVKFSEVVVVLLDAAIPFEQQDLRIADLAEREGRAVVVAVNKWDVESEKQEKLKDIREKFTRLLPQLRGAPLVTISAKTGRGLDRLHAAILSAHMVWNKRLSTSQCNRWLMEMTDSHPPPAPGGRRIRLRYMTQVKARPPSFVVMCSHPDLLPTSYSRYLVNGLREDFDMPGTPIRIFMRSQSDKNPYADKKEKKVTKLNKHQEGRFVKALGRGAKKKRT